MWGNTYSSDAKAALADAGIVMVDGELSSANVGAASPSDIPAIPEAANQADSTATTIEGLKSDFNDLLAKLKAAGIMEPDEEITYQEPDITTDGEPAYSGGG